MRKIFLAALLVTFTASVALAWQDNFKTIYKNEGIDKAVEAALAEGIAPDPIIVLGQEMKRLHPQNLLKALYCAGADGNDIGKAALDNEISELILTAAYEKSVTECGSQMGDTQAYTPAQAAPSFAGVPSPRGSSGAPFASPNTF